MIVPSPISSIPLLLTIYQIRSLVDKNSFPKKRFLLVRRFLLVEQEEKKRRKFEMLPHLPRIPLDVDPKNFNSSIHEVQLDRGARLDSTFTLAARRIVLHTWGPWAWKGRDAASWIFSENFWAKRHEFTGTRVFVHEKVLVSIYLLSPPPSPPESFPNIFRPTSFYPKACFRRFRPTGFWSRVCNTRTRESRRRSESLERELFSRVIHFAWNTYLFAANRDTNLPRAL